MFEFVRNGHNKLYNINEGVDVNTDDASSRFNRGKERTIEAGGVNDETDGVNEGEVD